jgi:hypothetical protein
MFKTLSKALANAVAAALVAGVAGSGWAFIHRGRSLGSG